MSPLELLHQCPDCPEVYKINNVYNTNIQKSSHKVINNYSMSTLLNKPLSWKLNKKKRR